MALPSANVVLFLRACGADLAHSPLDAMFQLYADLMAANERDNLTRITDERDFWIKHVADSLAITLAMPELRGEPSGQEGLPPPDHPPRALRVADVGCGAGFPLLVLAWANRGWGLTGFESRGKKAEFVSREAAALRLGNVRVVSRRAREAGRLPEHRGQCDVVLLRAVGEAGKMVRECRELLAAEPGAMMVHYKTPQAVAAERAMAEREAGKYGLGVEVSDVVSLPDGGGERQFIVMRRRA